MVLQDDFEIVTFLAQVKDPRVVGRTRYSLLEVLFLALCGAVAGCDTWTETAEFSKERIDWFRKFVPLVNGVPAHDTLGRIFALLDPKAFLQCAVQWTQHIEDMTQGRVVAIDGKTLRGSFDKATGKSALHLVSAWSTNNRMVLGQIATEDKSNEITAIPHLLELLNLSGATVTLDAMGTQKEIAAKIREKGADYILALKGNHPKLNEAVNAVFTELAEDGYCGADIRKIVRKERAHGRIETREYTIIPVPDDLQGREEWKDLRSLGMVFRTREINGATTSEVQYFLTSLPPKVKAFANGVRSHWGIENQLHWTLDVTFSEDQSRIRKGNGPETTALLRRLAVSILQQDTSDKRSLRIRRKAAGWNTDQLEKIIFGIKEN